MEETCLELAQVLVGGNANVEPGHGVRGNDVERKRVAAVRRHAAAQDGQIHSRDVAELLFLHFAVFAAAFGRATEQFLLVGAKFQCLFRINRFVPLVGLADSVDN